MRDFVHAGYLCVIEFEHISPFLPFARSASMRQFEPQFQVVAENAKRRRGIFRATLRDAHVNTPRGAHLETMIGLYMRDYGAILSHR